MLHLSNLGKGSEDILDSKLSFQMLLDHSLLWFGKTTQAIEEHHSYIAEMFGDSNSDVIANV